jgi:hypothetical protein
MLTICGTDIQAGTDVALFHVVAVRATGGPPVHRPARPFQQFQYISVHTISMEFATSADESSVRSVSLQHTVTVCLCLSVKARFTGGQPQVPAN